MKEELIKYVMEKADNCYVDDFPITSIEDWIREFFDQYQPERSKRENLCLCQYCEEKKPFLEIAGLICQQCMNEM